MVNNTMKKVAALDQFSKSEKVAAPPRSATLAGLDVEKWLREQVKNHKKEKATSAETKAKYGQVAMSLENTRPAPGEPVRIEALAKTKSTFYVYRAATRWSALERAASALRAYTNADNDAAKKTAYGVMLAAAADLVRYPADAQPGVPNATALAAHRKVVAAAAAMGLDAEIPPGPQKTPSEFSGNGAKKGKSDKRADANTIQKITGWRALLFARLVNVDSPWVDHAAVAALTGCRPAEVSSVRIEVVANALVITIPGVKVSDTKGQPYRIFTIKKDAGPEFAHLLERAKTRPVVLHSNATASAFSEALKRAGKQAFGEKSPNMTGYVYRHALACDMRADGAGRDEIASALGHAVTKTQSHYGRASGGTKGARLFQVVAARAIKQTHGAAYGAGSAIAPNAPSVAALNAAPVNVFTSPGFGGPSP